MSDHAEHCRVEDISHTNHISQNILQDIRQESLRIIRQESLRIIRQDNSSG